MTAPCSGRRRSSLSAGLFLAYCELTARKLLKWSNMQDATLPSSSHTVLQYVIIQLKGFQVGGWIMDKPSNPTRSLTVRGTRKTNRLKLSVPELQRAAAWRGSASAGMQDMDFRKLKTVHQESMKEVI